MTSDVSPTSVTRRESWFRRLRKGDLPLRNLRIQDGCNREFPFFTKLFDEIQMNILSFVADAPFEDVLKGERSSTLTDTLPLVSRKICAMARSNTLWEAAFRRAIRSDEIWRRAASALDEGAVNNAMDYRSLYKNVFDTGIAVTGPVFIMGMEGDIPETYELYLFEARYVFMIDALLRKSREWIERGEPGPPPPMCFLHAHQGLGSHRRFARETTALLVQMINCIGLHNGTYAVTLQVVAFVHVDRSWVVPQTGYLHFASGRRVKYV